MVSGIFVNISAETWGFRCFPPRILAAVLVPAGFHRGVCCVSGMLPARAPASPHSVIGPLQLRMPLGIGLNEKHILVEMDASGSASEDGSLALGDQITSVDGVELSEETTFIDALDRNAATHTLVAVRLALTVGQEWVWVTKTTQLALPMGLALDANNLVSAITETGSTSRISPDPNPNLDQVSEIMRAGSAIRDGMLRVVCHPRPSRRQPWRRPVPSPHWRDA